jgi:hypothetical protein
MSLAVPVPSLSQPLLIDKALLRLATRSGPLWPSKMAHPSTSLAEPGGRSEARGVGFAGSLCGFASKHPVSTNVVVTFPGYSASVEHDRGSWGNGSAEPNP